MLSNIGLIGLGAMGANLARNIAMHGFKISVWNRNAEKIMELVNKYPSDNFYAPQSFEDFINSLENPKKIIIMVPAGKALNDVLESLVPHLQTGDTIIDGGNSHFRDTEIFQRELSPKGIYFLGAGISGGEKGALNGPSIMLGGDIRGYQNVKEIFSSIAAEDFAGNSCFTYTGNLGSGHYVKMIHNGIEYAEMQMLAEAYDFFHHLYKLKNTEIATIFKKWSRGPLNSFLIDTVIKVLDKKVEDMDLIDLISDEADQKGTGLWTSEEALALMSPALSITAALYMRILSLNKDRKILAQLYPKHESVPNLMVSQLADDFEKTMQMLRLIHFEQGFQILHEANKIYNFNLNFSEIARVWQGGCIIRNPLLKEIADYYKTGTASLYKSDFAKNIINNSEKSLRKVLSVSVTYGLPMIVFSSGLTHFDYSRRSNLSTNLIQGMRDAFGSHGYKMIDQEGTFHANWE